MLFIPNDAFLFLDLIVFSNDCSTVNHHSPIWGASVLGWLYWLVMLYFVMSFADVTWIKLDLKEGLQVWLLSCSMLLHPCILLYLCLAQMFTIVCRIINWNVPV